MSGPADRLYHFPAARTPDQLRRMQELEAARICRFCIDGNGPSVGGLESALYSGDYWYVIPNDYPYAGTSQHYLIVSRQHVTSFDELPDDAGAELWAMRRKLKSDSDPRATATVERSGDMALNGGSVAHLHVHFLTMDHVPETPVRFRVSGHPAGEQDSDEIDPPTREGTSGDQQRDI